MNKSGGGKNTNINGLGFENKCLLNDLLRSNEYIVKDFNVYDEFENLVGKSLNKHKFYSEFLKLEGINYKDYNSKKWLPDDCFVNYKNKKVYIIEKKFQNGDGSVDEKLPNCAFKKMEYEKLLKPIGYDVEFIYILSDWFNKEKYKDILDYIRYVECDYYFNNIPLNVLGL